MGIFYFLLIGAPRQNGHKIVIFYMNLQKDKQVRNGTNKIYIVPRKYCTSVHNPININRVQKIFVTFEPGNIFQTHCSTYLTPRYIMSHFSFRMGGSKGKRLVKEVLKKIAPRSDRRQAS